VVEQTSPNPKIEGSNTSGENAEKCLSVSGEEGEKVLRRRHQLARLQGVGQVLAVPSPVEVDLG